MSGFGATCTAARVALDEAVAAVAALQDASLDACSDAEIAALLRDWEVLRNRMADIDTALVGQLNARGIAFSAGCKDTAAYLKHALRITPADARRRTKAASRFGVVCSGSMVAGPVYAPVAAAIATGTVSAEHGRVIVDSVEKLPHDIAAVDRLDEQVESQLLELAGRLDPAELAKAAQRILYLLDQDGRLADHDLHEQRRDARLTRRPDGTGRLEAELTCEAAELIETAFDALAKPAPLADDTPDRRLPGQRRHDALAELVRRAMRAKTMPATAGVTTTVIVHMDADTFTTGDGLATTSHGYTIPAHLIRRWCQRGDDDGFADARALAVLLSKTKRIEAYSSAHRIFTEQQRLAMMARDFGCSFPICDSTALHTEAHHLVEFQFAGPTSTDNGTLVCGKHHDQFQKMGWSSVEIDYVPHWKPPKWIDEQQHPIRRTDHDLL